MNGSWVLGRLSATWGTLGSLLSPCRVATECFLAEGPCDHMVTLMHLKGPSGSQCGLDWRRKDGRRQDREGGWPSALGESAGAELRQRTWEWLLGEFRI